jgi:Cu(I)/Ag(I) efflux system membrane fusion protein
MLLRLQIAGPSASRLLVPSEAVIRTGQRAVVLVRKDGGAFDSRDVSLGLEIGDDFEVTEGLREGEQVVVSGQFLIDSEARLRSVTGRMTEPAPADSQPAVFVGEGKVEGVDAEGITISHGPVAALKWPPMTMGFGKPDSAAFGEVKPGDRVRFEFKKGGAMDHELVTVQRLDGKR